MHKSIEPLHAYYLKVCQFLYYNHLNHCHLLQLCHYSSFSIFESSVHFDTDCAWSNTNIGTAYCINNVFANISDYDKNGGQSSNVDSGRGSVAYSSGRRPEPLHDTSADSDALGTRQPQPGTSQQPTGQSRILFKNYSRSFHQVRTLAFSTNYN